MSHFMQRELQKAGEEDPWALDPKIKSTRFYNRGLDGRTSKGGKSRKAKKVPTPEPSVSSDTAEEVSDFSDDDWEDDDVIIRTGDEAKPIPTSVLIEHKKVHKYAPETLMRLIPPTEEFDRIREDLRIQKTVYQYSPTVSNTVWEREYAKRFHKSPSKALKTFKVVYKGDGLSRFYGSKHPFSDANLFRKLWNRSSKKTNLKEVRRGFPLSVVETASPNLVRKQVETRKPGLPQISKLKVFDDHVIVNEIGGISYSLRTTKVNAEKWYRQRKGQPFFYNTFGVIRAISKERQKVLPNG